MGEGGLVYLLHLVWVFRSEVHLLSHSFRLVSFPTPQLVVLLWLEPNTFEWWGTSPAPGVCSFLTSMAFLYKETFFLWIFSMMLWNYEREQQEEHSGADLPSAFLLKVSWLMSSKEAKLSWSMISAFLLNYSINTLYCQKYSLFCLHKHVNFPFFIQRVEYVVGPRFAAIRASSLLGKISTGLCVQGVFPPFLLNENAWLAFSATIHPESALVCRHGGTGRSHPQTVY